MKSDQELSNYIGDDEGDTTSLALDVACPLGQQLIGALLGFLLAYIGILCSGPSIALISGLLAVGTSFGTLAAAVTNPFDVLFKEFLAIFLIAVVLCLVCFLVIGCEHLISLLVVSTFVSVSSSTARSALQLSGFFKLKGRDIMRTSDKLRV